MRTHHRLFSVALLLVASACSFSFSTANLSSLKVGKDKAMTQEASTFAPADTIFVAGVVSNSASKVTVKASFVIVEAEGQQPGPVSALDSSVNLDASGTANFTYSAPPAGWPKGKYKVDVVMLNDQGQQKDQKSVSFSVQ